MSENKTISEYWLITPSGRETIHVSPSCDSHITFTEPGRYKVVLPGQGESGTVAVVPDRLVGVPISDMSALEFEPAEPWTPKPGDRVRVKSGHHFVNTVASVKTTGMGCDNDLTVLKLESPIGAFQGDVVVATASLEPAEKPHISDVVNVTIKTEHTTATWSIEEIRAAAAQSAKLTPLPHGYFADMTMGAPYEPFKMPIMSKSTIRPRSISDQDIEDMINYAGQGDERRADGHSTGPILTGDARESYLAIQSGGEDPHAKPEPLTEPSCAYCKDTGIGETGMRCPVRTCEAVSS